MYHHQEDGETISIPIDLEKNLAINITIYDEENNKKLTAKYSYEVGKT